MGVAFAEEVELSSLTLFFRSSEDLALAVKHDIYQNTKISFMYPFIFGGQDTRTLLEREP